MVNEFVCNIKNIKFEKCKKCGYWFMHTKSKEQNYCNDIFEDNKLQRKNVLEKMKKMIYTYKNVEKDIKICISKLLLVLLKECKDYLINIENKCLNILSNINQI